MKNSVKNKDYYFIVVTYHPDVKLLNNLLCVLKNYTVKIIDNTKNNIGYAAACNIGIKQAMKKGAKWIIILNQDLQITPNALNYFLKKLPKNQNSLTGVFGGNLDFKRWSTILPAIKQPVDYLSGSFLAIPKKIILKVGFFYEKFFMYYEDTDYSIRSTNKGFNLREIFHSEINHQESQGLGKNSYLHNYYLARNHLIFIFKEAPKKIIFRELIRLPKNNN